MWVYISNQMLLQSTSNSRCLPHGRPLTRPSGNTSFLSVAPPHSSQHKSGNFRHT